MDKKEVEKILSDIQREFLKPKGFKKVRHTYSRAMDGYVEKYQIQGSAWNTKDEPWRFYINCGIFFSDIPRRTPDLDFPETHAHSRASRFVKNAPPHHDLDNSNIEEIKKEVCSIIEQASDYFKRRWKVVKDSYVRNEYYLGFPSDPELKGNKDV